MKMWNYIWFVWQDFGSRDLQGWVLWEAVRNFPYVKRANTSHLKMHPLWAKAKPISDGGSASVRTYRRRGANTCTTPAAVRREESECVRQTTLQAPRSVKEKGEEVLQAVEQTFPCSPWRRPWWGRLCPCSPWWSIVEQMSTCSLWRTPCQSRWMLKGGSDPVGSPYWSRFLAEPVDPYDIRQRGLAHSDNV